MFSRGAFVQEEIRGRPSAAASISVRVLTRRDDIPAGRPFQIGTKEGPWHLAAGGRGEI
jgi:hypothetical protein